MQRVQQNRHAQPVRFAVGQHHQVGGGEDGAYEALFDAFGVVTAVVALRLVAEIDGRLRMSEARLADAPLRTAVVPAV